MGGSPRLGPPSKAFDDIPIAVAVAVAVPWRIAPAPQPPRRGPAGGRSERDQHLPNVNERPIICTHPASPDTRAPPAEDLRVGEGRHGRVRDPEGQPLGPVRAGPDEVGARLVRGSRRRGLRPRTQGGEAGGAGPGEAGGGGITYCACATASVPTRTPSRFQF